MNDVELSSWFENRIKYEIVRSVFRQGSLRGKLSQREEKMVKENYLSIYDYLDDKHKPRPEVKRDSEEENFLRAVEFFKERPWMLDVM